MIVLYLLVGQPFRLRASLLVLEMEMEMEPGPSALRSGSLAAGVQFVPDELRDGNALLPGGASDEREFLPGGSNPKLDHRPPPQGRVAT